MNERVRYSGTMTYLVYYPLFWLGYRYFQAFGTTPSLAYLSFRRLYCLTNGTLTDRIARRIARRTPRLVIPDPEGVLGSTPAFLTELPVALTALRRDGYYTFSSRLTRDECDDLITLATHHPARLVPAPPGSTSACFDPDAPKAPRYEFDESDLLHNRTVQSLLSDRTLIYLAQEYLEAAPISDLLAMWWSVPYGREASSEAAQLFHFDMDRVKFLKVFVYVTDVDAKTGPHVFVKGTHRTKPTAFFRDRRFTDEEVTRAFPSQAIQEIRGPRGTIIAVDTSGLHKGQVLASGTRLIFQIEFTNSLFGQGYNILRVPSSARELLAAMRELPHVFRRFQAAASP